LILIILLEFTPEARQPLFFWSLLLKPGSPYCPVSCLLSVSCLSIGCHVLTSGTHEDAGHQRPDLNGPPPKIFSRSFAKNLFLKKTRKEEWALTSPTEGGPGRHPPRHSHDVPPATPEAQAKPFSFFWSLLLKPGSPYSFGGIPPKARQPLMLFCLLSLSVCCSRAYK